MSDTYNLYNLEAPFKEYLLAGNQKHVSIKNYLSDIRHFFGWLVSSDLQRSVVDSYESDKQKNVSKSSEIVPKQLEKLLTPAVINNYKNYFIANNLPRKTINRRLSTLRKFCSFCISQGWLKQNPAKKVTNIINTNNEITLPESSYDGILKQFQSHLMSMNIDHITITNYLNDVRELLIIS